MLSDNQILILSINDITSIKNNFVWLQKFCSVFLLYEPNYCRLICLIDLNLFYCTFVFEKSHQLFWSVKWFWNVFHINSVFLVFVITILIELVFLKLWTLIVVSTLRLRCFLRDWRRGNPKICSFTWSTWWRWKEWSWVSKSLALRLFLCFVRFILYLISPLDTFIGFDFFGRITRWLIDLILLFDWLLIGKIKIGIIKPLDIWIFPIHFES